MSQPARWLKSSLLRAVGLIKTPTIDPKTAGPDRKSGHSDPQITNHCNRVEIAPHVQHTFLMRKDPPTVVSGIVELRRKRQRELDTVFTRPVIVILCIT